MPAPSLSLSHTHSLSRALSLSLSLSLSLYIYIYIYIYDYIYIGYTYQVIYRVIHIGSEEEEQRELRVPPDVGEVSRVDAVALVLLPGFGSRVSRLELRRIYIYTHTHTHTHTHVYIYIYIYIYVCVCVWVWGLRMRNLAEDHEKKVGQVLPLPLGFSIQCLYLRILVYLVIYDSGQVSLEHLLLSRDPSQSPPHIKYSGV